MAIYVVFLKVFHVNLKTMVILCVRRCKVYVYLADEVLNYIVLTSVSLLMFCYFIHWF